MEFYQRKMTVRDYDQFNVVRTKFGSFIGPTPFMTDGFDRCSNRVSSGEKREKMDVV